MSSAEPSAPAIDLIYADATDPEPQTMPFIRPVDTHPRASMRAPARWRSRGARPAALTLAITLATSLGALADEARPRVAAPANAGSDAVHVVQAVRGARASAHEGVVEAVRQTQISAQVAGSVQQLMVKAGDTVGAGQVIARIDARAAEQGVAAGQAQVAAAQAQLALAASELERKRQLFQKQYISQGALDQAEAAHKATLAQVQAARAQTSVASTQTAFHVVKAPYAGVVAQVQVERGDMAMPGKPLATLYDPGALRVSAAVPSSLLATRDVTGAPRVEIPALAEAGASIAPTRIQVLPTVDPQSLTQVVRADLPANLAGLAPGQFARLWMPPAAGAGGSSAGHAPALAVPAGAVVRRSELTAVYVLSAQGKPVLRQVRLGARVGDEIEVLAGLDAGEKVLLDPARALREPGR